MNVSQLLKALGEAQRELERKARPGMTKQALSAIAMHECLDRDLPYLLFQYLEGWAHRHLGPQEGPL